MCVFLASTFSGLMAGVTFLFMREVWNKKAGLFAACFIEVGEGTGGEVLTSSDSGEGEEGKRMVEERRLMGEVWGQV